LGLALAGYLLLIIPFTSYLKNRPALLKVGYFPSAQVLKYATADQRYLVADWAVLKVIIYFGSLLEKARDGELYLSNPDHPGMFRILQTALKLEPYNMDAYYFAQAAFTWETGRWKEVNNLLEYGMRHRTWDYQLPFFAGFNAAYFMKDYAAAAGHMRKAAEIAKEQQFATLASRYFYEAGETDFAILFIDMMKKSAKTEGEQKLYEVRRTALGEIKRIKQAMSSYQQLHGVKPVHIAQLVSAGLLKQVPRDPYGGRFFIDPNGNVRSTSNLSYAGVRSSNGNPGR
jgi:hypothetical protein